MKLSLLLSVSLLIGLNALPVLQADAFSDDLVNAVKSAMTDPELSNVEDDDAVEGQVITCKRRDKPSESHTNETKQSDNKDENCK